MTDLDDLVFEYLMDTYQLSRDPSLFLRNMTEVILPVLAEEMKLSKDWNYRELYLALLEATAKLCRVSKYRIYTLEQLQEAVYGKLYRLHGMDIPAFVQVISRDVLI